jgi:hypothetical protein
MENARNVRAVSANIKSSFISSLLLGMLTNDRLRDVLFRKQIQKSRIVRRFEFLFFLRA